VQVAWDDYDKDYSDLPPAIAAAHAAATARQERQNAEEAAEKDRRKAVQVRQCWFARGGHSMQWQGALSCMMRLTACRSHE
jgi:hypothetical protein